MSPLLIAIGCLNLAGEAPRQEKVGIFDLPALRETPLAPEVVARSISNGVVTEAIRYTSEPGVRPLMVLTYKLGLTSRPGIVFARKFGAEARTEEAKSGFVGVSIAPPNGNLDPKRLDAVGGPGYNVNLGWRQFFASDPHQSWIYQNTLALKRGLDYLATRPEIDLSKSSVMGAEWAGTCVALLHALDDRPASYFVWNGMGFYSDYEGLSGGTPARISREAYEKYMPGAYAQFGTKPIYVANSLNALESRFDAFLDFAKNVQSKAVFALAPNRQIGESNFREFSGSATWQAYWSNPTPDAPPSIAAGKVETVNGKLRYTVQATGETSAVLIASYGPEGGWPGRTWQRIAMKKSGDHYTVDVPNYDPEHPVYLFAQISSARYGMMSNTPTVVVPSSMGANQADAFPRSLLRPDAFFVSTGTFSLAKATAKDKPWAQILPHWDGKIRLKNVQPGLWKDAKELVITLKGDGSQKTLNAYFAVESRDEVDDERQNYTMIPLLKEGETLGTSWRTFTIPLSEISDLARVDSLFFETGYKPLQIAALSWR